MNVIKRVWYFCFPPKDEHICHDECYCWEDEK